MSERYLIYALYHDTRPEIYVGQSSRGIKRAAEHASCPSNARMQAWIRELQSRSLTYDVVVLETLSTSADLGIAERFYISFFKKLGYPLLNATHGNDPSANGRILAEPLQRELLALVRKLGDDEISNLTGASKYTVLRAAIGLGVRAGSIALIEDYLSKKPRAA